MPEKKDAIAENLIALKNIVNVFNLIWLIGF